MTRFFLKIIYLFTAGSLFFSNQVNAQHEIPDSLAGLSDTSVTRETKVLFNSLKELSKTGVIFGHQHASYFGQTWMNNSATADFSSDCFRSVGSHPGVFGFDLNRGMSLFKDQVEEIFMRGGIVTFSDHAPNPVTGGNSWDNDGNAVGDILASNEYWNNWTNRLDETADFFNSLEVNGVKVPVIYRPLHEHTGKWFWWGVGNCTEAEYIEFWRRTIDYLRIEKGVTNMLVAISPSKPGDKQEMTYDSYPGDDYVDIIGFDMYTTYDNYAAEMIRHARFVTNWVREKNKVAAITETGLRNGLQNSTSDKFFTSKLLAPLKTDTANTDIAFLLTWSNFTPESYWVPLPGQPNHKSFVDFYQDPFTLFLDGLVDIYGNPFGYSYYDVSIKCIDGVTGKPISDAVVSLNKIDQETGQDGTTLFEKTLEQISFRIRHEDYYEYLLLDQTITSDTTIVAELEPYKNQVVIQVTDAQTAEAVDGCIIYFEEDSVVSGLDGEASIELHDGSHQWEMVRSNYHSTSGTLNLDYDTTFFIRISRSHANLKFRLREEGMPVKEAIITLGSDSLISNVTGIAEFRHIAIKMALDYTITKEGYDTIINTVEVQQDSTLEIEMAKTNSEVDTTINIFPHSTDKVVIYPNPVRNTLFFSGIHSNSEFSANIYNMAGEQLIKIDSEDFSDGVNIALLSPGTYILNIHNDHFSHRIKFMKAEKTIRSH